MRVETRGRPRARRGRIEPAVARCGPRLVSTSTNVVDQLAS